MFVSNVSNVLISYGIIPCKQAKLVCVTKEELKKVLNVGIQMVTILFLCGFWPYCQQLVTIILIDAFKNTAETLQKGSCSSVMRERDPSRSKVDFVHRIFNRLIESGSF